MQMSGLDSDEPAEWGCLNDRNWLHDALEARSSKWGLRFDRVNSECMPRRGSNPRGSADELSSCCC